MVPQLDELDDSPHSLNSSPPNFSDSAKLHACCYPLLFSNSHKNLEHACRPHICIQVPNHQFISCMQASDQYFWLGTYYMHTQKLKVSKLSCMHVHKQYVQLVLYHSRKFSVLKQNPYYKSYIQKTIVCIHIYLKGVCMHSCTHESFLYPAYIAMHTVKA